ncbi:DUF2490 domain-containing protein [Echinicola vietnamensis]|uniref:DUF2490 domain-containing protein n=1 Tax=Echinicola vietnamensis (strain DSM 17526 / LMG 23754 / KMM 6221) TaxID=926556 RepID=L0FXY7_ECHVK|nr:DUF2490 domain-containing protein [Echinicola vietnamensis]AGA78779.1 Protein of unknown function (DUF2490) [Echinicola vietnamensis DSM 17526]
MRFFLAIGIFFLLASSTFGQDGSNTYWGTQLETSYTYRLPKGWKANGKLYTRIFWAKDAQAREENSKTAPAMDVIRFSLAIAKNHSPFFSYGMGYLIGGEREYGGAFIRENRLFQQVTFSQLLKGRSRFAQQIRLEERFLENGNRLRLRLKFTYELPLQGNNLDPKEWYLLGEYEAMMNLRRQDEQSTFFSDNRFQLNFGRYTQKLKKIEYGVGYYLTDISKVADKEKFWFIRFALFLN